MKKYKEERPWGNFERFCHNEKVTVKIIQVNPNEELSLQYHHNRDEFWKVIEGVGDIVIGDETLVGSKGDEFFIPRETKHQIITSNSTISIMEISFGDFDENDIVRLSDKYNRNEVLPCI
jgi:mannose-6-phosphate isomerase-like protein (cupin superfamily)